MMLVYGVRKIGRHKLKRSYTGSRVNVSNMQLYMYASFAVSYFSSKKPFMIN